VTGDPLLNGGPRHTFRTGEGHSGCLKSDHSWSNPARTNYDIFTHESESARGL